MKKCLFAGTFDPFTVGHEDTVKKCLAIFDEVVVAVAENKNKACMFSPEEREEMIRKVYEREPRVRVLRWEGAVVRLMEREKISFYVRGVRNAADYEYETADFYASRDLSGDFIELYIPAEQRHLHISSSLVKNAIAFHTPYEDYVPAAVGAYLRGRA